MEKSWMGTILAVFTFLLATSFLVCPLLCLDSQFICTHSHPQNTIVGLNQGLWSWGEAVADGVVWRIRIKEIDRM